MLPARQSSEMAEEDEDESFGVEICKAGGGAVEMLEDAIRNDLAGGYHDSYSAVELRLFRSHISA